MSKTVPASLPQDSRIVWLKVRMTADLDPASADADAWRMRLCAFVARRGLVGIVTHEHIGVMPMRRAFAAFDRGLLIGWLLAQPEVTSVQYARPTSSPEVSRA